jgi:hypothetical protein
MKVWDSLRPRHFLTPSSHTASERVSFLPRRKQTERQECSQTLMNEMVLVVGLEFVSFSRYTDGIQVLLLVLILMI